MSAFLGPIHHWLFNKIRIQNTLTEEVIAYAVNKYGNILEGIEKFGTIPTENLEDIIDGTNIHGWLQERVSVVENRLAFAVTEVLKKEEIDNLKEIFFNIGNKLSTVSEGANAREVYKLLNDTLLDGMPCDHANSIEEESADKVIYKRNLCVHEEYWVAVGGNIDNYYTLRGEFIKGMLKDTGVTWTAVDEVTCQLATA